MDPIKVMAKCFAALPKKKLDNLAARVAAGAHVCCGPEAALFTDGLGGGCPATLASVHDIPMQRVDTALFKYKDDVGEECRKLNHRAKDWMTNFLCMSFADPMYIIALSKASEEDVKAALAAAKDDHAKPTDGMTMMIEGHIFQVKEATSDQAPKG